MNIYELNAEEIILFFVSLVRITSLFLIVPIFGDARIPPTVKILLSFTINIVLRLGKKIIIRRRPTIAMTHFSDQDVSRPFE